MRYWLGNLAMSMILIACFLIWQVHKGTQSGTMTGLREGFYIAGAVLAAALGLAGMKERHRKKSDDEIRNSDK